MGMDHVGSEYINGIPALNNLIAMIEVAIRDADIPFYRRPKSAGWEYRGFYLLENKGLWCGIYYKDHLAVVFAIMDKERHNIRYVHEPRYPVNEDKYAIRFRLDLKERDFFSMEKAQQLQEITGFVNDCYGDALRMRKY